MLPSASDAGNERVWLPTTAAGPSPTAAPNPPPAASYWALGAPRLVGLSEEDHVWVEVHQTTEEFDFELTAVDLYIGDFARIGYPTAFIGYRIDGTGQYLDVDIVQSEGERPLDVRGIRGIDHGNVVLPIGEPGVVVSAVYAESDPNCCPTSILYQSLDYVSGAWSINDGTLFPTASAPGGAFAF